MNYCHSSLNYGNMGIKRSVLIRQRDLRGLKSLSKNKFQIKPRKTEITIFPFVSLDEILCKIKSSFRKPKCGQIIWKLCFSCHVDIDTTFSVRNGVKYEILTFSLRLARHSTVFFLLRALDLYTFSSQVEYQTQTKYLPIQCTRSQQIFFLYRALDSSF